MSRAATRLGYEEQAVSPTPADLNTQWPFGQKYFPASDFTINGVTPASKVDIQIGTIEKTFTAIKYPPSVPTECELNWAFKDFQLDISTPSWKIFPIWFQSTDTPDPADSISIEAYIQNKVMGSSLDQAFDTGPSGTKMTSPTQDQWELAGGESSSIENFIAPGVSGDAFTATGTNFLQIQIERHGDDVADDYLNDAYMLGIIVQYKHDFTNVREWPDVP